MADSPGSRRPVCWSLHRWFQRADSSNSSQPPPLADSPLQPASAPADNLVATQPVPKPKSWLQQQLAEQAALETAASEIAEMLPDAGSWLQLVPKVKNRNTRAGRPKKAIGAPKTVYKSLTGQQRVWAVVQIRQKVTQPGASLTKTQESVARDLKVRLPAVKQAWKKEEFWLNWGQLHNCPEGRKEPGKARRPGQRGSREKRGGGSTGARQPTKERGYLGRIDYCREFVQAVGLWAQTEQDQGHELFRSDLIRQYILNLKSEIAQMEDRQADRGINEEQEKYLQYWKKRETTLDGSRRARDKLGIFLVGKTGFVERAKQRTTSLQPQEERERMKEGWQHWDRQLFRAGCEAPVELADWVAKPVRWVENRENIVISMSDQIPVWLKPDSGKRLVPREQIQKATQQRKRRLRRKEAQQEMPTEEQAAEADQQDRQLVCAGGNPANSRSRYTLIARQLIRNYFKRGSAEDQADWEAPVGIQRKGSHFQFK